MKAKRLAKVLKALSNEHRLRLYLEIAKHEQSNFEDPECNISDIVELFKLSRPTISHHLKELANADLITTERRGKYLIATINKKLLEEVNAVLSGIVDE